MSEELEFHPLADIFPLMSGAEFEELVADIKTHGVRESILLYEGKILDGRNRYRACLAAGWTPLAIDQMCEDDLGLIEDPAAYVISKNIHRRHLTAEQKREIIAKVIAAKPEASDRQIAKQVKADHKTVGSVRAEKEATGEVSPVEKRVGADGKARKQPEKKPKPDNGLNAVGKPYSPQFDPNYKMRKPASVKAPDRGRGDVIQDMLGVLSGLNKSRRADFFTTLWDKFRDELIEAQTTSHKKAVPPKSAAVDSADFVLDVILPEGNGADPEASAEIMKTKMAKLDIPEPATA